ncbi:radical SAM protein [bacterium]|nr:radical SAM protein [bacterium]
MYSSKNVLLINPWIYDFTAYDFWLKPLGLLYIGGLLEKYTSLQVNFIDCLDRFHPLLPKKLKTKPDGRGAFFKQEVVKPSVLKDIPRKYSRYGIPVPLFREELEKISPPELVLITCTMTYWYPGVQKVVELIREKFGKVPIVLGGVYASLLPQHAQRVTGVDSVLPGRGERKIFSLVREILGDNVSPSLPLNDLKELPSPAVHLVRDKSTLPLLTSRGCPFSCSYCAAPLLYKRFEQKDVSSIVKHIEGLHRIYQTQNIAFYDDALLVNKQKHIVPLLKEIIKKKIPVSFHTPNGLHIKEIDYELAWLLKKARFQSLFLSQESFDPQILESSSDKLAGDSLETALNSLERAGYCRSHIHVYLLLGLPGQDVEKTRESILKVHHLGARPRLAYFSPVPKTPEWQRMVREGYLQRDSDPLLHNKLVFPYVRGDISPYEFQSLKDLLKK